MSEKGYKILQKFQDPKFKNFSDYKIEEFAKEGGDTHNFVKTIKNKLKINQLRKFFSKIKQIELQTKTNKDNIEISKEIKNKLYLLIPELAYAYGRQLIPREFYDLMKESIEKIHKNEDFKRFVEFLTAIIAFYKMEN